MIAWFKVILASLFITAVQVVDGYKAGRRWGTERSYLRGELGDASDDLDQPSRTEMLRKVIIWEQDNAVVNRLADVFEQYTVGTGLVVTSKTASEEWNKRAKQRWEEWQKFPDLSSRQAFGILQSLIARCWFLHGEIFIYKTRGESGRPRLQLIEAHRVETPSSMAELEGETIIDGVQIDRNGRPVAYWVRQGNTHAPLRADDVIHVCEPSRPGMYRCPTFFHSVLDDIHDLDDLQTLEQRAAKRNSEIANVVTNEAGEAPDSDQMRRQRLRETTESSAGANVEREREIYYKSVLGGRTVYAKRGDKVEQYQSDRPGVAQREYWDYLTSKICAGVGISKQLVFPWSMQGTVVRADLDVANAFFRSRSSVMAWVVREIYIWVIGRDAELVAGRPDDWATAISIRPPRAVNVDVGRNSAAMLKELEAGATTFEDIYSPLGQDWQERLEQRAIEAAFIKRLSEKHGVTPGEISLLAAQDAAESEPDEEDGERKKKTEEEEVAA